MLVIKITNTSVFSSSTDDASSASEGGRLKLVKSLYGAKQSGRNWHQEASNTLTDVLSYRQCNKDPCVFYKAHTSWADEGPTASSKSAEADYPECVGENHFDPNDAIDVKTATPAQLNTLRTYQTMMGSAMYVATYTRFDICYALSKAYRLMHCASEKHVRGMARVIKYLVEHEDLTLTCGSYEAIFFVESIAIFWCHWLVMQAIKKRAVNVTKKYREKIMRDVFSLVRDFIPRNVAEGLCSFYRKINAFMEFCKTSHDDTVREYGKYF